MMAGVFLACVVALLATGVEPRQTFELADNNQHMNSTEPALNYTRTDITPITADVTTDFSNPKSGLLGISVTDLYSSSEIVTDERFASEMPSSETSTVARTGKAAREAEHVTEEATELPSSELKTVVSSGKTDTNSGKEERVADPLTHYLGATELLNAETTTVASSGKKERVADPLAHDLAISGKEERVADPRTHDLGATELLNAGTTTVASSGKEERVADPLIHDLASSGKDERVADPRTHDLGTTELLNAETTTVASSGKEERVADLLTHDLEAAELLNADTETVAHSSGSTERTAELVIYELTTSELRRTQTETVASSGEADLTSEKTERAADLVTDQQETTELPKDETETVASSGEADLTSSKAERAADSVTDQQETTELPKDETDTVASLGEADLTSGKAERVADSVTDQQETTELPSTETETEACSGLTEDSTNIDPRLNASIDIPPRLNASTADAPQQNASGHSVMLPMAPDRDNGGMNDTEECPADSSMPCVAKCCSYGEALTEDGCKPSHMRFIPQFTILVAGDANTTFPANETEIKKSYNLIANNICPNNRYRLEPNTDENDEFHLLFNGSLWLPRRKPHILMSNEYCMEVFVIDKEEKMLPLVCFDEPEAREAAYNFIVYPVGLLISVPFLFATFLVYALITELHSLPGKALACYVFCLMVSYIFLAVVQLGGTDLYDDVCVAFAFIIQFSFIASFFWLNVLCIDTARNVFFHGNYAHRLPPARERTYFIGYSLYAWSCTAIFIIVTMVMKFTPTIPSSYIKPSFGVKTCWFGTQKEAVPYFYAPIGALILFNVLLFVASSIRLCYQHHGKDNNHGRTPQQTLKLCITLFFMMGINWVMELLSWAAGGPNFIWYITDICNTLQGIFIFIIFVLDDRVRTLVRFRLLPRLRRLVPCCKNHFQPVESTSQVETINGRENTYRFNTKDDRNFA